MNMSQLAGSQSLFESYESSYCTAATSLSNSIASLSNAPLGLFQCPMLQTVRITMLRFYAAGTCRRREGLESKAIRKGYQRSRADCELQRVACKGFFECTSCSLTRCSLTALQLQRLDMEARSGPPDRSRQQLQTVKDYRADLNKLKDDVKRVASAGSSVAGGPLAR